MVKKMCTVALVILFGLPAVVSAFQFGYVDAQKIFNKYAATQETKKYLETEKEKLQNQLEAKKKEVADQDAKYLQVAKKIQDLRDAKKDAEAKKFEGELKAQRDALANANGELQKFFEESQKRLYELEEEKMGSLSKVLDERVDSVIGKIAKSKNLEAVFEKRFCYFGGVDITDEVLAELNAGGAPAAAKPAPKPAAAKPK